MATARGTVKIRPMVDDDRPAWSELWTAYLEFYDTELPAEVYDVQFTRLCAGRDFIGLVAENDSGLVGIAHCIIHDHGWRLEKVCYLQDLFAAPSARGSAVGRALIEAVYAMADARGAPHVYWLTEEDNDTARRLYDRIGTLTPFVKYVRPS